MNELELLDQAMEFMDSVGDDFEWPYDEIVTYEKQKKRSQRLLDCGRWAFTIDPHTGQQAGYTMKCDLFRECSNCLAERAEQEKNWIMEMMAFKRIAVQYFNDARIASNKVRGVGKKDYARFPQEDGTEVVFFDQEVVKGGTKIDMYWIMDCNWQDVVKTPAGRNKSGKLHYPKSEVPTEDFRIITSRQFVVDAPKDHVKDVISSVISATDYMEPTGIPDLIDCMKMRLNLTIARLREEGYSVRSYEKKLKVFPARINWQNSRNVLSLNTENSTLKHPM